MPSPESQAIARRQLALSTFSPVYAEELDRHRADYPHDILYRLFPAPGHGYGYIVCDERFCAGAVISLGPNTTIPDRGLAVGIGGLLNYRFHVNNHAEHQRGRHLRVSAMQANVPQPPPANRYWQQASAPAMQNQGPPVYYHMQPAQGPVAMQNNASRPPVDHHRPAHQYPAQSNPPQMAGRTAQKRPSDVSPPSSSPPKRPRTEPEPDVGEIQLVSEKISDLQESMSVLEGLIRDLLGKVQPLSEGEKEDLAFYEKDLDGRQCEWSVLEAKLSGLQKKRETRPGRSVTSAPIASGLNIPIASGSFAPSSSFGPVASGSGWGHEPVAKVEDLTEFVLESSKTEGPFDLPAALRKLGLPALGHRLPNMKVPLHEHQVLGVAWMLNKESSKDKGGLLADDMGLGKTVQMITVMLLNRPNPRRPTLIIVPLTIIYQWKDEVEDKANNTLKCGVYHASSKQRPNSSDILTYDVVLTTYDTMSREWPNNRMHREAGLLFKTKFHRVVLDESQQIRTKETVRSLAVANLQSDLKWGLSGMTPIINRLSDLYPFFRFAGIKPWCDYAEFRKQIVDVEKRDSILAAKKLQVILERMMIRRKKDTMVNGRPLVPLPPKNIELVRLEFTPPEQQLYDQYERRSQEKMQKLIAAGTVLKNCTLVLVQLLRLRQLCTHPSLVKDLDFGQEKPAGAVGAEDEQVLAYARRVMGDRGVIRLQERFREEDLSAIDAELESPDSTNDEECPICMDAFTDATVTACGHVFCRECINNVLNVPTGPGGPVLDFRPCPSCRTPCSKNTLFPRAIFKVSLNEGENDAIENLGLPVAQSTKMKWMMQRVQEILNAKPDEKILIISQWTQCLSLASDCLKEAGIVHVKYQGDMNQTRRSAAVKALNEEGDTRVMLLSLKCGGVGLNLTRANTVVSLDLGWSQAVEEQAFDRVHRIGQKREVKVHRLVIANTVEDRILALQARKQNLADGSLGEGAGAKIGKLSVGEWANLFGLDHRGRRLA